MKGAHQLTVSREMIVDYFCLWAQCNQKGPYQRERESGESETADPEGCGRMLLALMMEDGAESPGMCVASRSQNSRGNGFSHRSSRRSAVLLTLRLEPQGDPFKTADLQNGKIINLFCLKSLDLWLLVAAAIGNQYTIHLSF